MAERPAMDEGVCGAQVYCPGCSADIASLPAVARFCNRCGSALPDPPNPRSARSLRAGPGRRLEPVAAGTEAFRPPQILVAYGKALFNLGYRYETAIGSRRNLEEAARCYWKAARLGDEAARERCEAGAAEPAFLPYLPVPGPGGAPASRDPPPPFAAVPQPTAP